MIATAEKQESSVASLPICLSPWEENPYMPVSLWTMLEVPSRQLFWIGQWLQKIWEDSLMSAGPGANMFPSQLLHRAIGDQVRKDALICLGWVEDGCPKIGARISADTATDIINRLRRDDPPSCQWTMDAVKNLQRLLEKELSGKFFLYIAPERLRFLPTPEKPFIFGEDTTRAFRSAQFDMHEAGLCLGFTRWTAGVFHLMRVMEAALGVLGAVFGVSLAHTNWAPALDEIESKIRNMHKDPAWKVMPDCKEQQEFYAQAASHFGVIKDAWRNYTAHARGKYTEEEAALIFDNVRAFTQKLATRLHE